MIVTARRLAIASPKKPRQADLKRAISAAYYALFHAMAKDAAELLVGVGPTKPGKAWSQVYRSLEHTAAKTACKAVRNLGFPQSINVCADAFVTLQQQRHEADYDPDCRVLRVDAIDAIELAEDAIRNLKTAPRRDRKAFAVLLLLRKR